MYLYELRLKRELPIIFNNNLFMLVLPIRLGLYQEEIKR